MVQGGLCLEIGPSIVGVVLALPGFAIVQEHAGCKEELRGGVNDLSGGIGSIADGGKVEGVFDMVEEDFDWLIGIVGSFEVDIVVLEVGCGYMSVHRVHMIKDVVSGYI